MKKMLLSVLASLFLLVSCNKDKEDTSPVIGDSQIRPSAEVVETKAPINSGFTTDFGIGIYARGSDWLAGSTANWINNDSATVAGAAGHAITFAHGPYYYPTDGSTLNFFAFSPQAAETTAATAGGSPVVTHNITGQQDVMWATSTGYKVGSAAATNPVLAFNHQLTQLQFTFKAGTGFPASGDSVVSLLVKAQPTTVAMTVETGACVFSGSADMQALSGNVAITALGTNANSPVMTNISAGTYLLDIEVKPTVGANVTYSGVPVTLTSVIGSAHMITLTFNATTVTATATVVDWVTGASVDSPVE